MPEFFDLDKYNLDEEWANQPRLYYEHAVQLADARRELEQAKADRDVIRAEIEMDVRNDPSKYEIAKVTEGAIDAALLLCKRVQKADASVIEKKHAVDVLEAAVWALDHRKKALEKEVDLFLANYFAKPRTPDGATRERTDELRTAKAFGSDKKKRG